jgi:hypothetical protein
MNGKSLVIGVGGQQIVFKPNTAAVWVENLPTMKPPICPPPCTPNMNHFKALCKVVDSTIEPSITLAKFTAASRAEAGADYCPGGRV